MGIATQVALSVDGVIAQNVILAQTVGNPRATR